MTRIAAIDIGSNAIRCAVADALPDGSIRTVDDQRIQTRLAHGLSHAGLLADDRMADSLEAVGELLSNARGLGARVVRAVATAAVRSARNGPAFAEEVAHRFGLPVEVIGGDREALLALASARAHFDLSEPACIADIGGGSLEFVITHRGEADLVVSLPLGAVVLASRLASAGDPPAPEALGSLRADVRAAIVSALAERHPSVATVIGSGGTVTSLVGAIAARRGHDPSAIHGAAVSITEAEQLLAELAAMPASARGQVPGIPPYRADTVVPGGVAFTELMRILGAHTLIANRKGIRDGVLREIAAELTAPA